MRELFIEELDTVVGGGGPGLPDVNDHVNTTHACCEEGPFGCCGTLDPIRDLLRP
jgi:hypothetical protein